jgi:hypothetical protein
VNGVEELSFHLVRVPVGPHFAEASVRILMEGDTLGKAWIFPPCRTALTNPVFVQELDDLVEGE